MGSHQELILSPTIVPELVYSIGVRLIRFISQVRPSIQRFSRSYCYNSLYCHWKKSSVAEIDSDSTSLCRLVTNLQMNKPVATTFDVEVLGTPAQDPIYFVTVTK